MIFELPEKEQQTVLLRNRQGKTFREIADELGYGSAALACTAYRNILKKLRVLSYLQTNHPELLKVAKQHGYRYEHLAKLYNIMKRRNLLDKYVHMTHEKILSVKGIGEHYAQVLDEARELYWNRRKHLPNI